jgi:hypothetical protein
VVVRIFTDRRVTSAFVIENVSTIASPSDFPPSGLLVRKFANARRGLNVSGALIVQGAPGSALHIQVCALGIPPFPHLP